MRRAAPTAAGICGKGEEDEEEEMRRAAPTAAGICGKGGGGEDEEEKMRRRR